jgi:hypothetical protein
MATMRNWQKIGLLLSIFWIIGSLYLQYTSTQETAQSISKFSYETCLRTNGEVQTFSNICEEERGKSYKSMMASVWTNASIVAFLPLPFFWIYGIILITLARCIFIGSKEVLNLSTFSKPKRLFVYFCYFICALTVLFLFLGALNRHVDEKVPTYLGYEARVSEYDGYVSIEGTWVNGNSLDSKFNTYDQHQTSKIVCHKQKMSCAEAKAKILFGGSYPSLSSEIIEYDIKTWTKNSIVFTDEKLCAETVFTVDLNSKTVNGVERFANNAPNKDFCKKDANQKNTVFKLENGYTVYSNLRKEASPYFLKLFFALFGN